MGCKRLIPTLELAQDGLERYGTPTPTVSRRRSRVRIPHGSPTLHRARFAPGGERHRWSDEPGYALVCGASGKGAGRVRGGRWRWRRCFWELVRRRCGRRTTRGRAPRTLCSRWAFGGSGKGTVDRICARAVDGVCGDGDGHLETRGTGAVDRGARDAAYDGGGELLGEPAVVHDALAVLTYDAAAQHDDLRAYQGSGWMTSAVDAEASSSMGRRVGLQPNPDGP